MAQRTDGRFILPSGVTLTSKGRRLLALFVDAGLAIVTFGIGHIIWSFLVYGQGTTPGKKLLGIRVIKTDTMRASSWGYMFLREWIVKNAIISLTFGLGAIWLLWDKNSQNLYDKIMGTVVVDDPLGITIRTGQASIAPAGGGTSF